MMRWARVAAGLVLAMIVAVPPALAQRGGPDWILLGQRKVGFLHDRDVVVVDQGVGWLKSIRLAVEGNDVHMDSFRIVYENGLAEDFRVDGLIREGQQSAPIDLRGERSFIDRIELKYRSRLNFDGLATVKVFGEKVRDRPHERPPPQVMPLPDGRWEKLGEQSVSLTRDRDVIRVGAREGAFTSVLLRVRRNDIELRDLTVVYGNGQRDSLNVRRVIRGGTHTGVLDLKGQGRAIDRVELTYRSLPNIRGEAAVELWGRQAPDRDRPPSFGNDWSLLGAQTVGFRVDRDVVNVERRDGPISKLRFHVARNDVHLVSVRLVYQNGYSETLPFDRLIREGSHVDLDLRGERSYLHQIHLVYRARSGFDGNAVVRVYAAHPRFGGGPALPNPPGRWESLGRQTVGFGVDRDVIRVGVKEGRFDALVVRVFGNDVEMRDMKIRYGNGSTEDVPVRRLLKAGTQSDPFRIEARAGRHIDRIEMVYRSRPGFRGEAQIEVLGRHAN